MLENFLPTALCIFPNRSLNNTQLYIINTSEFYFCAQKKKNFFLKKTKMKIIPGNFLFLLIFAITLCIYPLYTIAQTNIFTHVEENNNYILPAETPRIMRLRVYDDNT